MILYLHSVSVYRFWPFLVFGAVCRVKIGFWCCLGTVRIEMGDVNDQDLLMLRARRVGGGAAFAGSYRREYTNRMRPGRFHAQWL